MTVLTPWQRLAIGAVSGLILWAVGVVGYITIEGFSFLDAVYQTITAITTAGFGEINPLGSAGRIFTVVIIVLGVTVILYVLTAVMQVAVEGQLESLVGARRMRSKIEALKGHYILCGFGRVGAEIAREFSARGAPFVIVENNPEAIGRAQATGYLLVEGDATSDATLREASIERARGLLAVSDSDAGNTFVILTAKALRPDLYIVSRAALPESEPRMIRAGADRTISPYAIAGRRIALSALQPLVVDFIDTLATGRHEEQILAEIEITEESGLSSQTIEDVMRSCRSAVVLGVQQASGALQVGPKGSTPLHAGDRLIVMGEEAELEAIRPRR